MLEEPEDSTMAAAAALAAAGATPIAESGVEGEPVAPEPTEPTKQPDTGEVPQGDEGAAAEVPARAVEDQSAPDAAPSGDTQ